MCEKDDILIEKLEAIQGHIENLYKQFSTLLMDRIPTTTREMDSKVMPEISGINPNPKIWTSEVTGDTCSHSFIEMSDGTFQCQYCPARKESDGKNL